MKWIKNILRKWLPNRAVETLQSLKKVRRKAEIEKQKNTRTGLDKPALIEALKNAGLQEGDTVLVHSSLSKIGYVEGGAATVVAAFLELIGENGHLLMPTSPNNALQVDYIKKIDHFDVLHSPSALGAITEYFRTYPGVKRSIHPTEPVSCWGKNSDFFVNGHFNQPTPYNEHSPFFKVIQQKGKIIMIGVTFDNAGTNLHCLEDAVSDFKIPVYLTEIFTVKVIDEKGTEKWVDTKIHNPTWSKKRRCDELIPLFEKNGVLQHIKIGQAPSLIIDAEKMFGLMLDAYTKNGVTMYTPKGV
jgi:aminoglycoside 3-N-acetyltransferase